MVFYRKYRPQIIEELDSKDVRDTLYAILSKKDISHAFLFTGPKGLGKTSTARIVAKAVNCERLVSQRLASSSEDQKLNAKRYSLDASSEPCNKCYQCTSITNGTNIDVLEIDGASNRGIDEIRDLREKVRLSPASALKKIYIIDEVHMLTQEAFNALLKTLEEPPAHVIFILCTTEPHKVPATISSRCFSIQFKKAEPQELIRSFRRIGKIEKLDVDNETLELIANLSDGSFRDGTKILEEMALNSKEGKITKDLVEKKYQISNIKYQIAQMFGFLEKKDTKQALKLVTKLVEQGVDMKYFIEQLINTLHGLLLYKVGAGDKEEFSIFNFQFSIEEIKELVGLLSRAYGELKYAVLPQLPLEMAIVEWGVQKTQNTQIARESGGQKVRGSDDPKIRLSDSPSFPSVPKITPLDTFWKELIDKVKLHNHSIAGVLRGCTLKEYDGKNLVLETKYKFHKERLSEKKILNLLEKIGEEITSSKVKVSIVLKE